MIPLVPREHHAKGSLNQSTEALDSLQPPDRSSIDSSEAAMFARELAVRVLPASLLSQPLDGVRDSVERPVLGFLFSRA